jgi:tetratricopeptide (TPR) repeat protein
MNTQILTGPPGEQNGQAAETLPGGTLQSGENAGGWELRKMLSSSGGEAEIYLCSRDGKDAVFKYYHTIKPKGEVTDKIRALSHPNIISTLDSGEYQGRFYTVMEYAEGGALDDKLSDGSWKYLPMSEEEARGLMSDIIGAFDTCHRAGIIHRDIKPGNIFYKNAEKLPDGKYRGSGILVADFGIASVFEVEEGMSKRLTETDARTEGYAAPEVYSNVIGPEMDYYSLGVTLWALLTGKEPFVNEEERVLTSGQIMLDTIHGKTADKLLARSAKSISVDMQKLIRGLLTTRHDKRWGHDQVARHLAGENVDIFTDASVLPAIVIAGENCTSYQEIAQAIISHPEEGKKFVFGGKLTAYLFRIQEQKLGDQIDALVEKYSGEKREDDGVFVVAYTLCLSMPFYVDQGVSFSGLEELCATLETHPDSVLPYLREEKKGLYAYLEAMGLGEQGKKVKEVVKACTSDLRATSRIIVAFQGNSITPFQDGRNNEYRLETSRNFYDLPDYLKKRALIFIERNCGPLPAWIENIFGVNIDLWLTICVERKDFIKRYGKWEYFLCFLKGKDLTEYLQFLIEKKNVENALAAAVLFKSKNEFHAVNILVNVFGRHCYEKGDWQNARAFPELVDEKQLEGLSHGYDFYCAAIGCAWAQEGKGDKAAAYLQEAFRRDQNGCDIDGDPYALSCGMGLLQEKNFSGALELFNQALAVAWTVKSDLPVALYGKAACLLAQKKYEEAAAACSLLLDNRSAGGTFLTDKRKGRVFMMRSLSYFAMGTRTDQVVSDRANAEKLGVRENAYLKAAAWASMTAAL